MFSAQAAQLFYNCSKKRGPLGGRSICRSQTADVLPALAALPTLSCISFMGDS